MDNGVNEASVWMAVDLSENNLKQGLGGPFGHTRQPKVRTLRQILVQN